MKLSYCDSFSSACEVIRLNNEATIIAIFLVDYWI